MAKNLTVELLGELIADESPLAAVMRKPSISVRDLPDDERRAYKAERQAERRAKLKERAEGGSLQFDAVTTREALADAALMILGSGAAGADAVENYLKLVFADQPGAAFTIRTRARSGQMKPKLLKFATSS